MYVIQSRGRTSVTGRYWDVIGKGETQLAALSWNAHLINSPMVAIREPRLLDSTRCGATCHPPPGASAPRSFSPPVKRATGADLVARRHCSVTTSARLF